METRCWEKAAGASIHAELVSLLSLRCTKNVEQTLSSFSIFSAAERTTCLTLSLIMSPEVKRARGMMSNEKEEKPNVKWRKAHERQECLTKALMVSGTDRKYIWIEMQFPAFPIHSLCLMCKCKC